ncbi:MAG: JAB domain-containing protein [Bacteroidetes bacterium]|jgi:DNA repair protein RadC|nr:MAG: JAB domain-containing protein [Bacteroidota bacterium]
MEKDENPIRIKSWCPSERPRERLLQKGAGYLSDAELLAILLGSGSKREHALSLARRILGNSLTPLRSLGRMPASRLMEFKGVGPGKAVVVLAAMELARRYSVLPAPRNRTIRQSSDAYEQLRPLLSDLMHEEFWVLYLNNANRVQNSFQLSKGGLTGTLVDVRLILKKALELGAVGLILAHNHPSGNLRPSKADLQITRKTKKAAALMDIRLLDHLIVHGSEYYSFADGQQL